jgi:hypothetical protein
VFKQTISIQRNSFCRHICGYRCLDVITLDKSLKKIWQKIGFSL